MEGKACHDIAPELAEYVTLLEERADYFARDRLDTRHDSLLKAYGDVIHHDHSLNRFYRLCVALPPLLGQLEGALYLHNQEQNRLECVCSTRQGLLDPPEQPPDTLSLVDRIYETGEEVVYPLQPHPVAVERKEGGDRSHDGGDISSSPRIEALYSSHALLGVYAVSPPGELAREDRLFFRIMTRWMAYKLKNRLIANRLREHLRFLNALGRDIGHNVILPNMRLKYLLGRLGKKIAALGELESRLGLLTMAENGEQALQDIRSRYREYHEELQQVYNDVWQQHGQITLYLESLFRQEHFTRGHLVLQPRRCFVERDIILPQLALFRDRFEKQGITIKRPMNMVEQQFPLMVDRGLLSQVYANLFSNAIKYTGEIIDHNGRPRKAMAYGVETVQDFPKPGKTGIKFNVFTTGQPLSPEECRTVFEEGARGPHQKRQVSGSGHGLDFIRRVIEVHGGQVGCEATEQGNNFYFILPLSEEEATGCHDRQEKAKKGISDSTSSPSVSPP